VNPLGDAFAKVLAICIEMNGESFLDGFNTFDGGHQFHAVIGGIRFTTGEFFFMVFIAKNGTPTTGSWISLARAVCKNFNNIAHFCVKLTSMKFTPSLQKGHLVKRYKRFMADVLLPDGTTVTVHCPNSGSMKGLVDPGNPVWISESPNQGRKLRHTLEIIEVDGVKVGVNTHNPNLLVREALESGALGIAFRGEIRREVKYGENSRIDFLLEAGGGKPLYVEVKNVTLKEGELALFPDSVTERGKKHLEEMMNVVKEGARALMVYVIQRSDCEAFSLATDIDPQYAETLKKACAAGVEICAYQCRVDEEEIRVEKPIEIRIFE